ncbi:MAG: ABC transporter ATP-binding protein [Alphaproteobacteria bacterium]|jgi:branched-chain amino acid transport system ATP-binding protein|nr:ABC transporter ATP-binding protein [Alphaproteobacteria bacterium]
MTLLQVEDMSKAFGANQVIEGLSFAVNPGAIHSIIGPNGAGKTTLFNLITGIYRADRGRVLLDGQDVTAMQPHDLAKRGISRTFQNLQVFLNMSALENVMAGMHLHSDHRFLPSLFRLPTIIRRERELAEEARRLMAFVNLDDFTDAHASAMPYGALKRLEIARALATKSRLMLLDEPAAGLNPSETRAIDGLIQKIAESGVTVILVEHDMRLVMGVSDHILVLESGRKLAEGTAGEIRHNPDVVAAYLGESALRQ